ncbi:hypothetical protein EB809_12360, partial [Marinobacter sp. R17]
PLRPVRRAASLVNLNFSNRPVRTRLPGGVGGAEPEGSPLSRCARVFASRSSSSENTHPGPVDGCRSNHCDRTGRQGGSYAHCGYRGRGCWSHDGLGPAAAGTSGYGDRAS